MLYNIKRGLSVSLLRPELTYFTRRKVLPVTFLGGTEKPGVVPMSRNYYKPNYYEKTT
jgi:hypothetical protein